MERELYPFELDIMERFSRGGKYLASPKSEWIRGYLLTFKTGYPYAMWKEYRFFAGILGINPGTYISFARTMWILKRLGLVTVVSTIPGSRGFPRTLYAITPGMENSPLWKRPEQALYPSVDWTLKPEEVRRALREKYRKRRK